MKTIVLCILLSIPAFAGKTRDLELRWRDLSAVAVGRDAVVHVAGGRTVKGEVIAVRENAIVLGNRKAQVSVLAEEITAIDIREVKGPGRFWGRWIGLMVGAGQLPPFLWPMTVPFAITTGYFVGKDIDTRITLIKIMPDSPGAVDLPLEAK